MTKDTALVTHEPEQPQNWPTGHVQVCVELGDEPKQRPTCRVEFAGDDEVECIRV